MELLSIKEVANILGVTIWTVRNYIKEGKLDCYKISRRNYKISSKHLAEFLNKTKNQNFDEKEK